MDFMALMSLKSAAKSLTLMDEAQAFSVLLKPLGFDDVKIVESVLFAAKQVASDPKQTVMQFVEDGGLMRMLAGQKGPPEDSAIECPHCANPIFLSLS